MRTSPALGRAGGGALFGAGPGAGWRSSKHPPARSPAGCVRAGACLAVAGAGEPRAGRRGRAARAAGPPERARGGTARAARARRRAAGCRGRRRLARPRRRAGRRAAPSAVPAGARGSAALCAGSPHRTVCCAECIQLLHLRQHVHGSPALECASDAGGGRVSAAGAGLVRRARPARPLGRAAGALAVGAGVARGRGQAPRGPAPAAHVPARAAAAPGPGARRRSLQRDDGDPLSWRCAGQAW